MILIRGESWVRIPDEIWPLLQTRPDEPCRGRERDLAIQLPDKINTAYIRSAPTIPSASKCTGITDSTQNGKTANGFDLSAADVKAF